MSLVSDKFQRDKLKKYNINIKTKYIVGNNILERNSNDSHNDDIVKGIRCSKEYYLNNSLIHKEKEFDSRIEYSFINPKIEDENFECPNCGMISKKNEFISGCPYCGTYYNIDYTYKELGGKYHYDQVLRSSTYRLITAIIDIIISLILSFIFIKYTSRTFNIVDISKVIIYGIILSLILYYLFYIVDAYVVLSPIKSYKNKQNQKQIDFWNRTNIDKKTFFNNFNYELRKKYYLDKDIIDYDIIDYLSFEDVKDNDNFYVKVKVDIRIVYFKNNKIYSKYMNCTYLMKKIDDSFKLKDGVNIIKCHNCGASVDVTKGECEYCHTEISYLQDWIMVIDK